MSDIAISISGVINFSANLYRVTEPKGKGESFKLVCPTCDPVTKPSQTYICPSCTGQFPSGELGRAREVGKTLVRVTDEEVAAVRTTDLAEKELRLTPYRTDEVLAAIRPSGECYRIDAVKFKEVASMAFDLVQGTPDTTYLGEMNTGRGGSKVFALSTWNGTLVAQEMARPDEVIDFEPVHVDYDERLLEPSKAFVGLQTAEFTAENFANLRKARLAELDASKGDGTTVPVAVTSAAPSKSDADNLLALLEAQIAASKAS
jgi:hypothetical protein